MAQQKLTIFQKLTKAFGFQGQLRTPPQFEFKKEELLKTDSKDDYEKARLQAQQTQYIADKWSKLDMSLYNQSVYYEPNRLSAYYDFESMEFSLHGDTQIVTPNGNISIKELAEKGRNFKFITYAYDHNIKKVVPVFARNAHYTRDDMTYKITFDDDKFIIASLEHRFLKRDGVFCKVKDLKVGDSMMPFYRKSFYKEKKYNWIYSCNTKLGWHGWIPEHTLVAEHLMRPLNENEIVHHLDFNAKNNLPENLKIMNSSEHQAFHARHNNKKLWSNPEYVAKMKIVAKSIKNFSWKGQRSGKNNPAYLDLSINTIIDSAKKFNKLQLVSQDLNVSIPKIRRTLKFNGYQDWHDLLEKNNINIVYKIHYGARKGTDHQSYKLIPWDLLVDSSIKNKTIMCTARALNVSNHKIMGDIKRAGFNDWQTFIDAYTPKLTYTKNNEILVNHKIKSIEPYGIVPVYDLTVPGYKNFATDTIFSHNTPEISAALDIYSEESTTKSEKGQILTIHSDSKRIKHILDDLFYNTLDINTNLTMWCRGMCKYGDNFVYLKIKPEKGVVGCQQLPNIEVERLEGARQSVPNQSDRVGSGFPTRELRFTWKNKDMEFQSWEIAHFRILGDDRKLPYGTSMLDKIRRIWKQLLLAEDAMLIYRTSRAPERRVFKVFVGNMDDKDIEPYVQRIANKFKRDQVVDQKNGNVDMRYNQMPVWKNTPIPLLDGRTITIEELAKEYEEGKTNWVYSVQDETSQILPGKVVWCGKNYTANRLIKVWLDDDTWIMTAPEHPFVLRDGSHKPAKELNSGDSLMPFYTKKSSVSDGMRIVDYEMIFNPRTGKYEFIHRIVGNTILFEDREDVRKKTDFFKNNNLTIHHVNFDKNNNSPDNLEWIGNVDHIELHKDIGRERLIKYNTSQKKRDQNRRLSKEQSWYKRFESYNHSALHKKHDEIRKISQLKDWSAPEKKIYRSKKMRVSFDDYVFKVLNEKILSGDITNRKTMLNCLSNDLIDHIISINNNKRLNNLRKIERTVLEREINERGFDTITNYISGINLNHKVSKIDEFYGNEDVYCMTVVGPNGENDRHNFAVKSFKIDGLISLSGLFTVNSVDQDYFIPVRDPSQPNPIETLPGAQNLGEIADIEYIQKKMLAALRIPKAFLGFEDVIGNGKGLALLDIRFARTVNRIQMSLIQELNKIALIHLFLLGFEDELNNFTLSLTNPSGQSDLLRIESWKEKITMYKDATSDQSQMGILPVSHTWAKKNILGMSDNEVILDLQQQRLERALGVELTNTASIIRRTGVFDEVDKKYGIPEEEREKIESGMGAQQPVVPGGGGGVSMGGMMSGTEASATSAGGPAPTGAEAGAPLSESKSETKKEKILSMLNEDTSLPDLFDIEKAQKNIYEIENKLKDILNQ